jgi:SAM-dependent methyltransferase
VIRAIVKGSALFAFGRFPGGPKLYRSLTRDRLGTQATHVDKLARVWPKYARVWSAALEGGLSGRTLWVHEGGHTPFPFLIGYLLTGSEIVVTNCDAHLSEQYLKRAVTAALALDLPPDIVPPERIAFLREAAAKAGTAVELIAKLGGRLYEGVDPRAVPLADESADLCHSGGALEHYTVLELRAFFAECFRVLRPGGVSSHVFDHRDHLYHADKKYPFLFHLSLSDSAYRLAFGHKLLFHNRLLPGEIKELFCEAGFEFIALRRTILPSLATVDSDAEAMAGMAGLPRRRLAKRFRAATDADLRTAAAHYLFRKPDG